MKFSVIVPIYNSEKVLDRCITSILSQTYTDFELILIDDGSKDSSLAICKKYQAVDSRIICISKANGGVSSARNAGLDIARGERIVFIDSDDYVNNNYLESLNIDDSDLIICGITLIKNNISTHLEPQADLIYKNQYARFINNHVGYIYLRWPVCKSFTNEIIKQYHIRFDENLHCSEDFLFVLQYMLNTNSIRTIDSSGYYYILPETEGRHEFNLDSYTYATNNVLKYFTFFGDCRIAKDWILGVHYSLFLSYMMLQAKTFRIKTFCQMLIRNTLSILPNDKKCGNYRHLIECFRVFVLN